MFLVHNLFEASGDVGDADFPGQARRDNQEIAADKYFRIPPLTVLEALNSYCVTDTRASCQSSTDRGAGGKYSVLDIRLTTSSERNIRLAGAAIFQRNDSLLKVNDIHTSGA